MNDNFFFPSNQIKNQKSKILDFNNKGRKYWLNLLLIEMNYLLKDDKLKIKKWIKLNQLKHQLNNENEK